MKTGRFFALFTLLDQVLRPFDSLTLWSYGAICALSFC